MSETKNSELDTPEQQYLLSDKYDDLADYIQQLKLYVSGDSGHTLGDFGVMVPRFGLLSMKMRRTPMYVYDHPSLTKFAKTAFTDGRHIFVYAGFLEKLLKEEDMSKGSEQGATPLVLHELFHMILNHTRRLTQFPHDIANRAEDLLINTKLQLSFPEIKWCPTLREVGLGFKPGDIDKYPKLAEETIARELIANTPKKPPQPSDSQKGQGQGQPQPGNGQPGQSQPGQGQPQPGQGQGQPQQGKGQPGGQQDASQGQDGPDESWGGSEDRHTVPLEELIEALEEAGLQGVIDKLELPESDDVEKIGQIEKQSILEDIDDIQKAQAQRSQMGGKYPGGHIVDAAAEIIKGFTEGKLEWKLGMREFVMGDGMRFRYSEEEPADIYYVDPTDIYGDSPNAIEMYIGSEIPHKPEEVVLCLIDTSGSVDDKMMKTFISEILALKKENDGDTASEVLVLSADTVLRGELLEITDYNVDKLMREGVGVFGRGGTDLNHSLHSALKLPVLKDKKVKSVVYFTDLCDSVPKKENFPEDIVICFVTTPEMRQEEFARGVKDWARVYPIQGGITVNLTEDHLQEPIDARKQKLKR